MWTMISCNVLLENPFKITYDLLSSLELMNSLYRIMYWINLLKGAEPLYITHQSFG
jgi:hypothetical protein